MSTHKIHFSDPNQYQEQYCQSFHLKDAHCSIGLFREEVTQLSSSLFGNFPSVLINKLINKQHIL